MNTSPPRADGIDYMFSAFDSREDISTIASEESLLGYESMKFFSSKTYLVSTRTTQMTRITSTLCFNTVIRVT
jgi:hypothetical protein